MALTGLDNTSVELRITSDQGMTTLHHRHLGGVGPTNVLSFPADDAVQTIKCGYLGSIVVSADAVLRESFLYLQDPQDHFIRLLTHALLHLAGFAHGEVMDELTEKVVGQLGFSGDEPGHVSA
jgi:probable rRNA maturation factor